MRNRSIVALLVAAPLMMLPLTAGAQSMDMKTTEGHTSIIFCRTGSLQVNPETNTQIIKALANHPIIMQRPIVIDGDIGQDPMANLRDISLRPKPQICGNMNHIQWLVLRPRASSRWAVA